MRALRAAAASMRTMSRHRRAIRPVLRFLRTRARARPAAADLVAPVDAGSAGAPRGGVDRRHLVGGALPLGSIYASAARTRHRSCDVRGCDGRTRRTRAGAVDPPAASAPARGDTRCRPPGRASIDALRHRGRPDRAPRAGTREPEGRRCDARRPAGDSASRRPRKDRLPRPESRLPITWGAPPAPRRAPAVTGETAAQSSGCRIR